jgi:hypothetical protein
MPGLFFIRRAAQKFRPVGFVDDLHAGRRILSQKIPDGLG